MRYNIFFILYFLSIIPHMTETPWWVFAISLGISAHAYLALSGRTKKLSYTLSGLLSALALSIVLFQFKTLLGPEPATALLIMLAALKLEEIRSQRDGVIYLFLLILIVMYYLLFSQSILSTIYMLAMCISITIGFIVINTPKEHLQAILKSSPKLVSKDLLLSLPIFLVLFAFFPRFSVPWASYLASDKSPVGFSEDLEPGQMAELARSREPAFSVTFLHPTHPTLNQLYWRGIVLVHTDGWRWKAEEEMRATSWQKDSFEFEDIPNLNTIKYQVQIEPKFQKRLFVLDHTQAIQWSDSRLFNNIRKLPAQIFKTDIPIVARTEYQAYSLAENSQNNYGRSAIEMQESIEIPPPSERMKKLISEIKRKGTTPKEISQATLDYFTKNNFQYSLSTPEMKSIDDFIFDQRVGFCEHYASAFAAIMRWSGVHSRVISGFQGGEYNEFADFLLVRDQHAHSWTEIFDGENWIRVDPTSSVNATRISMGSLEQALPNETGNQGDNAWGRSLTKMQMAFGALEQKYNQFLMNYNYDAQEKLLNISIKPSQKRWLMFLGSAFGVSLFLFIARIFIRTKTKKDHFQELLNQIHFDLEKLNVGIDKHDPISRTMLKTMQKWPEFQNEYKKIESLYLNHRFNKNENSEATDRAVRYEIEKIWIQLYSKIKKETTTHPDS